MINVLSLFSGIGAFEKALDREHIDYELVNYCEIDKYASKAYAAVHGVSEDLNLKDVTKIDTSTLKDIDLITYGFPCQDISQAGNQKGFIDENGNTTRSGLFFEALRIIENLKPKYAIAENVKALTSKKFTNEFRTVLESLEQAGYNNYYDVLNAKDYGIPQNRERVFIISIRKDIDNGDFAFPEKMLLNLRLRDILENEVDEKFYLSNEQIKIIKESAFIQNARKIQNKDFCDTVRASGHGSLDHHSWDIVKTRSEPKYVQVGEAKIEIVGNTKSGGQKSAILSTNGISSCLRATDYKQPKQIIDLKVQQIKGNLYPNSGNPQADRVYNATGLSPSLDTCQGGNRMPQIVCEQRSDEGLRFFKGGVCGTLRTIDACGDKRVLEPQIVKVGNVNPSGHGMNGSVVSAEGLAGTITTNKGEGQKVLITATAVAMRGRENGQQLEISDREYSNALTTVQKDSLVNCDFRIRKLTPLECWRLMGFDDEDFYRAQNAGISNSQLYKQAGNSIVVNVLQAIFRNLFNNI